MEILKGRSFTGFVLEFFFWKDDAKTLFKIVVYYPFLQRISEYSNA
jgi:hypothetical protein